MTENILFADVILPLPLPDTFTYQVPPALQSLIAVGHRVVVQFGKQRVYAAIVSKLHNQQPEGYITKDVLDVIDEAPVVTVSQFKLWQWMSNYYLAYPGEIMAAALPVALRLQSESVIVINDEFNNDTSILTDKEFMVWEALQIQQELTLNEIGKILSVRQVMPIIRALVKKKVVQVLEEIEERYKPKLIDTVDFHPDIHLEDDSFQNMLRSIEKKAPKQLDVLLALMKLKREQGEEVVLKSILLKESSSTTAIITTLVKKNILVVHTIKADRIGNYNGHVEPPKSLNDIQQIALNEVRHAFDQNKVTLLHGVTSSGKTEIYIHLIEEQLKNNKQVLYLLPEIALTSQIIHRLQKHFGQQVLIYHSRFNEHERVEVWNKILDDNLNHQSAKVVIGARSSVFLPFEKLGLVIVDEEHDPSYKQTDPSPRYNGRDVAIVMASLQGADVLLGSATPGIETYFNAITGKFALVNLKKRYAGIEMPDVLLVNVQEERQRKAMKGNFSAKLIQEIETTLASNHQVILFQNRRGFAPFLECGACSWVPVCSNCDVSFTYHKNRNELKCHYCGHTMIKPVECNRCHSYDLQMRGFGTERIEEDLKLILPEVKVARLDHDTTRTKNGYQAILGDFEAGNIDILVGTQMVTKGLDFDRVQVVGILNADSMLHYPDFRSNERGFQLLSQVSGRAGRKNQKGKVIVQTYSPDHAVLQDVINHDYQSFYKRELMERYNFGYPPYSRLIEIRLKHQDYTQVDAGANELTMLLKRKFGKRVLGPNQPSINRIRNYFIRTILLKVEKSLNATEVKKMMGDVIHSFKTNSKVQQLIIQIDVDPI
ncbi:MAG: primosomal protein N' [Bacteroidota bacterium]